MDGLSAVASVIAVIQISEVVVTRSSRYYKAVKNAKSDIENLLRELSDLKTVVERVQQLLKGPNGARLRTSQPLHDGLEGCSLKLQELEKKLKEKLNPGKDGKIMSRIGFRALEWPFEREEVNSIIQTIKQYQDILSDSLTVDQTAEILEIGQKLVLSKLHVAKDAAFNSHADEHVARCYSYIDEHVAQCHPDTRVALRQKITRWAEDPRSQGIFWLNGMAGTGKSTISRSVAQFFADNGQLGASFFFKRGESDRDNAVLFSTTVAAQLVAKEPALAIPIRDAIDADPGISGKNFMEQFNKLVLKPLGELTGDPVKPRIIVIVVDALDECEERDARRIIYLLSQAKILIKVKLRIFVTSRPDLPIQLGFGKIKGDYQDILLHEVPKSIIKEDIATFLKYELTGIRVGYNDSVVAEDRRLPLDWPDQGIVDILVEMAVPLFIFAATVCRFVGDIYESNPAGQLAKVLKYQTEAKESEMDKLNKTYRPVLDQLVDGDKDPAKERRIREFREVVGSIVLLAEPLSTSSLASLLNIPKTEIDRRLNPLHSVLSIPSDPGFPVRLLHLSFRDFLVHPDKYETNPFWVDERKTHEGIAHRCLQILYSSGHLKRDICGLEMPGKFRMEIDRNTVNTYLPAYVRYACQYWVHHLGQSQGQIRDEDQVHRFLTRHFLHWLEALSLMGKISESISMINTLQNLIEPEMSAEVSAFLRDAKRFILNCISTVDLSPLQLYSSAIAFSPHMSVVRTIFEDEALKSISIFPKVDLEWNACLQTLEGHTDLVNSVAFSHDSRHIASASYDDTVRIWEAATGQCLQTLNGHTKQVISVAFSHDSKHITSASFDSTIRIWDAINGQNVQTILVYTKPVWSVNFSHDSKHIASALEDYTVRIWQAATGQCHQILKGHTNPVKSVAFSHDSKHIASASYDNTVRIWDTATGQCLQILKGHTNSVESVAFSHDSKHIASASYDNTVRIWDTTTGQHLQTINGHSKPVSSVAFSHNSKYIASASQDYTIQIWNGITGQHLQTLKGHTNSVTSATFSHDSKYIVSASFDNTIRIWDTAGQQLETLKAHATTVSSISFSRDLKQIVSASYDNTIRIWDTTTGQCLQTVEGHTHSVVWAAFSHDSKYIASTAYDNTVRIWEAATGQHLQTLKSHGDSDDPDYSAGHVNSVNSAAFSHDSKYIASTAYDNTIRIWEATTGQCLQTLRGHTNSVNVVAFSHDSKHIASASSDNTVRIWEAITGQCLQTLNVGTILRDISFDSTRQHLYTTIGTINLDLTVPSNAALTAAQKPCYQGYGLSFDGVWIMRDAENFLRLPAGFRANRSAVRGSTVVIGCRSGRVIIFKFLE